MTIEEFFGACKENNSELSGRIEALRAKYELECLYLIHIYPMGFAWGYRGGDVDLENFALDLVNLTAEYTGITYDIRIESFLLDDCVEEVEFLIDKFIRPYVESHEGKIDLVSVDEKSGKVFVSMSGTCGACSSLISTLKNGVEEMLKARLPWVKEVGLADAKPKIPASSQAEAVGENVGNDISITEAAARKIRDLADEKKLSIAAGMRIKVSPGGCSGFEYVIELEDKPNPDDSVSVMQFTQDGNQSSGRVFIDPRSLPFLKGSTLDYVRNGLSETFKISNPNAKSSCGCGNSNSF